MMSHIAMVASLMSAEPRRGPPTWDGFDLGFALFPNAVPGPLTSARARSDPASVVPELSRLQRYSSGRASCGLVEEATAVLEM